MTAWICPGCGVLAKARGRGWTARPGCEEAMPSPALGRRRLPLGTRRGRLSLDPREVSVIEADCQGGSLRQERISPIGSPFPARPSAAAQPAREQFVVRSPSSAHDVHVLGVRRNAASVDDRWHTDGMSALERHRRTTAV
jgi:hypothetical protein